MRGLTSRRALTLALAVLVPALLHAQATAKMVKCKDGTKATAGAGACDDHGGVAADSAGKKKKKAANASKPSKAEKAAAEAAERKNRLDQIMPASGGGPGLVWVNTRSGAFHRQGDELYGKTKQGKYMSEADALKSGFHAGKAAAAKKP